MNNRVENDKYLLELSKSYPKRSSVMSEIINLNAILNLPKGTEHFTQAILNLQDLLQYLIRFVHP